PPCSPSRLRPLHRPHPRPTLSPYTTLFRSKRPLSRADIAILKPSPSSPRRFSVGTLTLSKKISPVFPARIPSFPSIGREEKPGIDRKSTRLNSSHVKISYAVFCLEKKNKTV